MGISRREFLRNSAIAAGLFGAGAWPAQGDVTGHGHHRVPVPTTTTTSRTWPASFLTGPLGANNLLPTGPGAFLCSMFGGSTGAYTQPVIRQMIQDRQAFIGRTYDVIQMQYDGALGNTYGGVAGCTDPTNTGAGGDAPGGVTKEQFVLGNGSEFAVVWTPLYSLTDFNAGTADAILTKLGQYWATYKPHRVMLRIFHEFDIAGRSYSVNGTGSDAATFISAWQRAVDKIRNAGGADNVGFWWCPSEGAISRTSLNTYYPGDAYVDWVGTDWYNSYKNAAGSPTFSSPIHIGWAEWWELFNYSYSGSGYTGAWSQYDIYGSGLATSGTRNSDTFTPHVKPFMVGETSTPYDDAGDTMKKSLWFHKVVEHANGLSSMPNCVGISFYDQDVHSASDWDWRMASDAHNYNVTGNDPDATTFAGFKSMVGSPLLHGR